MKFLVLLALVAAASARPQYIFPYTPTAVTYKAGDTTTFPVAQKTYTIPYTFPTTYSTFPYTYNPTTFPYTYNTFPFTPVVGTTINKKPIETAVVRAKREAEPAEAVKSPVYTTGSTAIHYPTTFTYPSTYTYPTTYSFPQTFSPSVVTPYNFPVVNPFFTPYYNPVVVKKVDDDK